MPDNAATITFLDALAGRDGPGVDFVVYWTPSPRAQWRRLARKVKAAGIRPALQRTAYALTAAVRSRGRVPSKRSEAPYREYHVPGHNSPECRAILEQEQVDVLVLSTDAIIGSGVLGVPRLVTLNAHPGWVPQDRGLGSNLFRMERGQLPAVSIHAVDEGIDTGPLIRREVVRVDARQGLDAIEELVDRRRLQMLREVVADLQAGAPRFADTFSEPSNMTRGMPARRRKRLDARLRSGHVTLS